MKDIRLYTYNGYGILKKWNIPKQHKSKSVTEAMGKVKLIKSKPRRGSTQLVLIDYDIRKIIFIS